MKRFLAVVLSFVLIFNFVSFSYADTIDDLKNVEIGSEIDNISKITDPSESPEEIIDEVPPTEEPGFEFTGFFRKMWDAFIGLLSWIVTPFLWLSLLFPTIDGCIFNKQDAFKLSFFEANPSGLAGSVQALVSAVYNGLRYLVTAIYIVVLVYLAIRMMFSSIGRQKAHYKELFKHWIVGLLLLFSFHWVMAFIIWISNTFVDILSGISSDLLNSAGLLPGMPTESLPKKFPITAFVISRILSIESDTLFVGSAAGATGIATLLSSVVISSIAKFLIFFKLIAGLVLSFFFIWSSFSILVTYLKRLFTIAILILTFPLVALSYVFDKIGDRKAQTLSIWLKEFTVNVMIQPIHALILVLISILFASGLDGGGLFGANFTGAVMCIIALRLIPLGEELLKKLFQISSNMGPGSNGIAGSMASAGMALQGMKNMASTVTKPATTLGKYLGAKKNYEKLANEAKNTAFDRARKKGLSIDDATKKADQVYASKMKSYKKDLEEKTGYKSATEAMAKNGAQLTGSMMGLATAITGSGSGKFFAEGMSRAALGAGLVDSAISLHDGIKTQLKGDPSKEEEYIKRAKQLRDWDFDTLPIPQKKKIASELGLGEENYHLITNANKDLICQSYEDIGRNVRYGMDKDKAKESHSLALAQKNISKGYMPDGSTPLDINLFDDNPPPRQCKDGLLVSKDGTNYIIPEYGNSKLEDGKYIEYRPDLRGLSIKDNVETILSSNSDYTELKAQRSQYQINLDEISQEKIGVSTTMSSHKKAIDRCSATIDTYQATIATTTDPSEKAKLEVKLGEAQLELNQHQTELQAAQRQYNSLSQNETTIKNSIKDNEAKQKDIRESTIKNNLDFDKIFSNFSGHTPFYTENGATQAEEAFSWGVCDELQATLDNWDDKPVEITLTRQTETSLHCVIRNSIVNNNDKLTEYDINVGDGFNNPQLAEINDTLTIYHNKNGWFIN